MLGGNNLGAAGKLALQIATIPGDIRRIINEPSEVNPMILKDQERFSGLSGWTPTERSNNFTEDLGLLLLNRYDGDERRWVVELVDLNQTRVLHTWKSSDETPFYTSASDLGPTDPNRKRFSHPLLLPNGSLIGIDGNEIVRAVDRCGTISWNTALFSRPEFHHSTEVDAEGHLWIPSRIYPQTLDGVSDDFLDDAIAKLSLDGKVLFRRSVAQILIDNGFRHLIFGSGLYDLDPIHLNDIQPVNHDGLFWEKGDLFLSLRHQSMIMLYRPSNNTIIWSQQGPWNHQHDVDILNEHQISIFDNNSNSTGHHEEKVLGHNQVMVYDFVTKATTSPYAVALAVHDVRTPAEGRSEIYPSGDVFVEETNYGRLLRVALDGALVWQYINRATDGNLYHIAWSRIIKPEQRSKFTAFLDGLTCVASN